MKRAFLFKFTLLIVVLLGCYSCSNNDDEYSAFGTITSSTSSKMTLACDDGKLIELYADGGLSAVNIGYRAYVIYTLYDDGTTNIGDDFVKGDVVDVAYYKTQTPNYSYGETSDELFDKYGTNEIDITSVVYGGGFLHFVFTFGYEDPYELRSTTLVVDMENSTDTDVYAYFYYLAADAEDDSYSFSYETQSFICVDVTEFVTDPSITVSFHIITEETSGSTTTQNEITVSSDNVPTIDDIFENF
ncbi:MAG: hypothetical protein R3Y04_00865 [Rikenellaceae bacterium]